MRFLLCRLIRIGRLLPKCKFCSVAEEPSKSHPDTSDGPDPKQHSWCIGYVGREDEMWYVNRGAHILIQCLILTDVMLWDSSFRISAWFLNAREIIDASPRLNDDFVLVHCLVALYICARSRRLGYFVDWPSAAIPYINRWSTRDRQSEGQYQICVPPNITRTVNHDCGYWIEIGKRMTFKQFSQVLIQILVIGECSWCLQGLGGWDNNRALEELDHKKTE